MLVSTQGQATIAKDTTAQHEIDSGEVPSDIEMKDELLVASKPEEAGTHEVQPGPGAQLEAPDVPTPEVSPSLSAANKVNGTSPEWIAGEPAVDKSDSEAETVVLSGKEEGKKSELKKAIKLEESNEAEPGTRRRSDDAKPIQEDLHDGSTENEARKPSLKRKRILLEHGNGEEPEGANSSNLSSTISSPVQEAHSSKATDTASNRSQSSPPPDAQGHERRAQKARSEHRNHRDVGKAEGGSRLVTARKRRDTCSATHFDEPIHRSESPPSHHKNNNRAQSVQSNPPHSGVTKRRRAPAPLQVERRRKASEDTHLESEDDSSVHSHHHLQRLASTDNNAMSPAKVVSSKKNRDRNGRTLLARACQSDDVAEVAKWLKERPQDINVPDNAGNTPFQIAALDGSAEIVQLLLDAGCDIDCRNIDKDTPLIDAVENGHIEVVQMLLRAGLDPRQTNAFGKEPLDLVKADNEYADEIREALQASKKEKATLRRPSEDFNRQHSAGSREIDVATGASSGASPVNSTRSPPPIAPGARRRTARSQPTDDALLWVNATPARLRDAAGKGDMTIVDHILKMRPQADTESILAAARGGHDEVLNLMLAIATPDPDPEPLKSGDYKPAYSTPMLAAIGRGNTNIIKLLLTQPGFDPTRRLYKGMTYYELAKERQGSEWQEEYEMLKGAYDTHRHHGGRKSNHNSPRKGRPRRADSAKSSSEPSSSPHEARRTRKPSNLKEDADSGIKRDTSHRGMNSRYGEEDRRQRSPGSISDHERGPLGPPRSKVNHSKSGEDREQLTNKRADSLKMKRRLISGNEFRTDQDLKRRASLAAEVEMPKRKSEDSAFKHEIRRRRFSDASESKTKVMSGEPRDTDSTLSRKRHRMSLSPQANKADNAEGADAKRKKRQRVNSQGKSIDQDGDRSIQPDAPAMVANMFPNSARIISPTTSQGTAPVAFMGSNVTSPTNKSPTEFLQHSIITSPVSTIDQTISQRPGTERSQVLQQIDESNVPHGSAGRELERQIPDNEANLVHAEEERLQQAQGKQEKQAQVEKEETERKARMVWEEEEQARLEEQRQSAEAERQIRLEREQEEGRLAKLKHEEDLHQRRMEHERVRKEEAERRRREAEERENIRRLRLQEEEERQRLQSLPNGLRRAAELSPEAARNRREITKWLPLRTVTTEELDPSCEAHSADERWIPNVQAAPILAVRDLDLSQCKYPPNPLANTHSIALTDLLRYRMASHQRRHEPSWIHLAPASQPHVSSPPVPLAHAPRSLALGRRDQTEIFHPAERLLDQAGRLYGYRPASSTPCWFAFLD